MKEERFNEIPLPPQKPNKKKPFGTDTRFKPLIIQRVSPASYTIPTVFEMEKYKKKGKSISCFREKQQISDVPGPGNYNQLEQIIGPLYSIGEKITQPKKDNFPAPNQYDQNIKLSVTKYKKNGTPLFSRLI